MRTLIRLEELGIFLLSIYLFAGLDFPWWYFPILLFMPDVSMTAYLVGPTVGAAVYNLIPIEVWICSSISPASSSPGPSCRWPAS